MLKLHYLGPEGSFSHLCAVAVLARLNDAFLLSPCLKLELVLEGVEAGDMGLLPLENSVGGGVQGSLDGVYRLSSSKQVLIEYVLPVTHSLYGFGAFEEIQEIKAHYQAHLQCAEFLAANFPKAKLIECASNSQGIASLISSDTTQAAIGNALCAELHSVPLLRAKINDRDNNRTRFWLLGEAGSLNLAQNEGQQRLASLAFDIPLGVSGGLVRSLRCFSERGINLTRIESRPSTYDLGQYVFFVDILVTPALAEALDELRGFVRHFRLLGEYSIWPDGDGRFIQPTCS